MKNLKILGGLLIVHALNSCGILPEVLPDETQSGKNTFGCKVNGKIFTPADQGLNKGGIGKDYDGNLTISASNGDGRNVVVSIANISTIDIYNLVSKGGLGYDKVGGCSYGGTPISGKVEITKFERGEDKANNLRWLIVSGRFEGVIVSDIKTCKDTIRITDGRFDVKFQ
jgi:hypothetical protein